MKQKNVEKSLHDLENTKEYKIKRVCLGVDILPFLKRIYLFVYWLIWEVSMCWFTPSMVVTTEARSAWNFVWLFWLGTGASDLRSSSAAFLGMLRASWSRSGTVRNWASRHTGYWHCRLGFNLTHQNVSPLT